MFDRVRIRIEIFKEGNRYVSVCPELNVSSYGDTPEEARESLKEAVSLFLEECDRMGTLKDILEEAGFDATGVSARSRGFHKFSFRKALEKTSWQTKFRMGRFARGLAREIHFRRTSA